MYCSQCGNSIDPQGNFCARCGFRVSSGQHTDNKEYVQTAPLVEKALWVLQAQRKYSMVKLVPCNIVFLQNKIVLAHLTPALQKTENTRVSQQIKTDGKGFFKGSAQMMSFWSEYHKKYYMMPAEAILAEDQSNVVIDNPTITQVLFRGFSETVSIGDSDYTRVVQGKLELTFTNKDTIKFTHSQSAHKSIQELLTSLYGEKLKYKK